MYPFFYEQINPFIRKEQSVGQQPYLQGGRNSCSPIESIHWAYDCRRIGPRDVSGYAFLWNSTSLLRQSAALAVEWSLSHSRLILLNENDLCKENKAFRAPATAMPPSWFQPNRINSLGLRLLEHRTKRHVWMCSLMGPNLVATPVAARCNLSLTTARTHVLRVKHYTSSHTRGIVRLLMVLLSLAGSLRSFVVFTIRVVHVNEI